MDHQKPPRYSPKTTRSPSDKKLSVAGPAVADLAHVMEAMQIGMEDVRHTIRTEGTKVEKVTTTKAMGMDVCFLLDISGSMNGSASKEMVSQLNWLIFDSRLLDRDNDTVQIFAFNNRSEELLRPKFLKTLERADIDALGIAARCDGGTKLWTALNACLDSRTTFMREKEIKDRAKIVAKGHVYDPARFVRKAFVLLVLTDGASQDSADLVTTRLRGIVDEIPNFHMTLLGIGVDKDTGHKMQSVARVCGEAGSFINVAVGAGQHASEAIAKGFRTHFTQTVEHVRKIIRELSLDPKGHAKLTEHIVGPDGHPVRTRKMHLDAQMPIRGPTAVSRTQPALDPPAYHEIVRDAPVPVVAAKHDAQAAATPAVASRYTKPCKNGASCLFVAADKCTFFHPSSHRPCRFGSRCRSLTGAQSCDFRHDTE